MQVLQNILKIGGTVVLSSIIAFAPTAAQAAEVAGENKKSEYEFVISPEMKIGGEAEESLARIKSDLAEIKSGLNLGAVEFKTKINKIIAELDEISEKLQSFSDGLSDELQEEIGKLLQSARATLVEYVEDSSYKKEYDTTLKQKTYDEALEKARANQTKWQKKIAEYESGDGVVGKIKKAESDINSYMNSLPAGIKTVMATVGITTEINIDDENAKNTVETIKSLLDKNSCNAAPWVLSGWGFEIYNYSRECSSLKNQINSINNDLADYLSYKDLIANPPADPEEYARDAAEKADLAEQARARTIAQNTAKQAGVSFDLAIAGLKQGIVAGRDKVVDFVGGKIGGIKSEINSLKTRLTGVMSGVDKEIENIYQSILDNNSGLKLVSTASYGEYTASREQILSFRDIVEGNYAIKDYVLTVSADAVACGIDEIEIGTSLSLESTLPEKIEINKSYTYTMPELKFAKLNLNLPKLELSIPGVIEGEISSEKINTAVNGLLDQSINRWSTALNSSFAGQKLAISVNKVIKLPKLAILVNEGVETRSLGQENSCGKGDSEEDPEIKAPQTGFAKAEKTQTEYAALCIITIMGVAIYGLKKKQI